MAESKGGSSSTSPTGRGPAGGTADVTHPRGAGDTAPTGTPNTSVPLGAREDESDSARGARELREAAESQPMSEGVRQDLMQGGRPVVDPISGREWTLEDLSSDDQEEYRRSHKGRTER